MTRYLIFLRPEACRETTPEALSKAAGISRADANRAIRSGIPRSIDVCENRELAKSRILALREEGLDGIVVAQDALHSLKPIPVTSATEGNMGMFWNTEEEMVWLGTEDVRMIITGKIHGKTQVEAVSGYISPFIPEIPMMTRSFHPPSGLNLTKKTSTRFILLFTGANEAYLVRDNEFDFNTTLGYACTTQKLSFEALLGMIRKSHPTALFDDFLYTRPQEVHILSKGEQVDGIPYLAESVSRTKEGSTEDRVMMLAYLKYAAAMAGKD